MILIDKTRLKILIITQEHGYKILNKMTKVYKFHFNNYNGLLYNQITVRNPLIRKRFVKKIHIFNILDSDFIR